MFKPLAQRRTKWNRRHFVPSVAMPALAASILALGSQIDSVAHAYDSPPVQRRSSERIAAAVAAKLGYEMQEWLQLASSDLRGSATLVALHAGATGIGVAAGVVGVSLLPRPPEATRALPTETVARVTLAFDTHKRWRSQVAQHLTDEYLLAHYLVGEAIGTLRQRLGSGADTTRVATLALEIMATRQIEMSVSLRSSWVELAKDLGGSRPDAKRNSELRQRLASWFDEFTKEVESQAK